MDSRPGVAMLCVLVMSGCSGGGGSNATPTASSPVGATGTLQVTPSTLTLTVGEKAGIEIRLNATSQNEVFFVSSTTVTSTNTTVATVSPVSQGTTPGVGVDLLKTVGLVTVTGVSPGLSMAHVSYASFGGNLAVDIPVTVTGGNFSAYDGTYVGDASPKSSSIGRFSLKPFANCPGAQAYGETMVVSVNATGAATLTMKDTPNFNRAYSGTISSALAFSGQNTFSYLGASIPGQLSVTFISTTKLSFQETTTYGTCSSTYEGTLTKQ
jgi:hypothetical protein